MQKRSENSALIIDAAGSSVRNLDAFGYHSQNNSYFKRTRTEFFKYHYALGAGHRVYSSTLRRFLQPDRLSPFMPSELNSYSYCLNDPINREDPSGRWSVLSFIRRIAGFGVKASKKVPTVASEERGVKRLIMQISQTYPPHPRTPLLHVDEEIIKTFLETYPAAGYFNRGLSSDSPDFLQAIEPETSYLFVMSNEGKMFVHPETTFVAFQPGIAHRYAEGKKIIAAGELRKIGDFEFMISHHAPFYYTISNLVHPSTLLASRGARVTTQPKLF